MYISYMKKKTSLFFRSLNISMWYLSITRHLSVWLFTTFSKGKDLNCIFSLTLLIMKFNMIWKHCVQSQSSLYFFWHLIFMILGMLLLMPSYMFFIVFKVIVSNKVIVFLAFRCLDTWYAALDCEMIYLFSYSGFKAM